MATEENDALPLSETLPEADPEALLEDDRVSKVLNRAVALRLLSAEGEGLALSLFEGLAESVIEGEGEAL